MTGRAAEHQVWAQEALGLRFDDPGLLGAALAHSGTAGGGVAFQRLEFLGDRVLALAAAAMLHEAFPDEREGHLARRHAALVRRETLAEIAATSGLERVATLPGAGDPTAARGRAVVLADTLEAVLGAVFLDGGWDAARAAIARLWTPLIDRLADPPQDAKTRLQEWAQARGAGLPGYRVERGEGPDHAPAFVAHVEVTSAGAATGAGPSKREAEQAAAAALLERLEP